MSDPFEGVNWTDARDFGVRGQILPNAEREQDFDRWPLELKPRIEPELWQLGTCSAGLFVDFAGAPTKLFARWTLTDGKGHNPYVTLCAHSGLDLYARDYTGVWRHAGAREPWNDPDCHGGLTQGDLEPIDCIFRLYLPLFRRVGTLEIGAREPLTGIADSERDPSPIVYYGTSIVHGAAASRPGMPHAHQLSRALDREIINLGMSGRARCEVAVAEILGKVDTPLYIMDALPNNNPAEVLERFPPFIRALRAAQPHTPILFVEDRKFGGAAFVTGRALEQRAKNQALRQVLRDAAAEGIIGLHLASDSSWFGDDGEGTVDSSHSNDLGANRMATKLYPIVKNLLSQGGY